MTPAYPIEVISTRFLDSTILPHVQSCRKPQQEFINVFQFLDKQTKNSSARVFININRDGLGGNVEENQARYYQILNAFHRDAIATGLAPNPGFGAHNPGPQWTTCDNLEKLASFWNYVEPLPFIRALPTGTLILSLSTLVQYPTRWWLDQEYKKI